jgi:membrane-bound lytic murein transglycosylase D
LKRETREFVPRFQAIAHIAKNPDKYGFAPVSSKVDPEKYEYVVVEGSYSFDALARAMRVTSDELGELNPSFIRGMTPPSPHHPVRVPLGKKETLLAGLKSAPQERGESHIVHVVNKGESVARIAGRFGVPRSKLAHLNPDVNLRKKLKPGAKLVIPVGRTHSKERAVQKRPDRLSQL